MHKKTTISLYILTLFFSLTSLVYAEASSTGTAEILWIGPTPTNFWFMAFAFMFILGTGFGGYLFIKKRKPEDEDED